MHKSRRGAAFYVETILLVLFLLLLPCCWARGKPKTAHLPGRITPRARRRRTRFRLSIPCCAGWKKPRSRTAYY